MTQALRWALAVLAVAAGAALVGSQVGALDGRAFDVQVTDPAGVTSDDTLVFADGLFRSVACDAYGFAPAPYATEAADEGLRFSAVAESDAEGTNRWSGVVGPERVWGTFVWSREGQEPVEYTFSGSLGDAQE